MDILESFEVRWFLPECAPELGGLEAMFPDEEPEERVDDYLRTGRDDVGFKVRDADRPTVKVETKFLVGSLGALPLAPDVTGAIERWQKLSVALSDPNIKRQGEWVRLTKSRRLRKFEYADGALRPVPANGRVGAGCGFELTRLGGDRRGWTVGLEAFGPPATALVILQETCRAVFTDKAAARLDAEASRSYPGWLLSARSTPQGGAMR